jgi:hypothetical protein
MSPRVMPCKEEYVATQLDFDYDLAQFISFRDREACDRVRQITREQLPNHESPDFRIRIFGLGEGR